MANYLFATVGGRDVQFKPKALKGNALCAKNRVTGEETTFFLNPRAGGKIVSNGYISWKNKLQYPILDPVVDYLNDSGKGPDKIFLFVSDQKPVNNSDTIFFGEILKKHLDDNNFACKVIKLKGDPTSFDKQYDLINKYLGNTIGNRNVSEDTAFVFPQSGTPATRNALLLNCMLYFPLTKQLSKPRDGKVTEQHFPKKFREQVKQRALPSRLKETLATISARNLSHTDGSHVMISFQKNLKEKLSSLQSSPSSTEFANLKDKYDAFSNYLRGQMEYVADLSGQTASQTFFDYDFGSEVENLKKTIHSFLGNGLIDDLKNEKGTPVTVDLTYTNESKIVSIPGGSNGVNAFYTIVKNFIRNLYKHSSYEVDGYDSPHYDIYFLLKESGWNDFYQVTLYDSITYEDSWINGIINGTGGKKGIKQCIDDKLLDDNGAVRDYGWGILEMKIAACYLTGLPLIYFDEPVNDKGKIDLSKKEVKQVFPKPLDVINYKGHLAYQFYLLKPETFLAITDNIPENKIKFQNVGITFSKGDGPDTGLNTRAKFIIDTRDTVSGSLKPNNIRRINFFKEGISTLLDETKRSEIIAQWQQKMFLADSQDFTGFKKIDLSNGDGKKVEDYKKMNNLIMIDSHGNGHQEMDFSVLKEQGYFYYSTLCSKDKNDIPSGEFDKLKWEQVEAVFTKVAILDERIQNKADEEQPYIHKLARRDLLELRGIFVPKLSGNDDENAFDLRSFVFGNNVQPEKISTLEEIIKSFLSENHYVVLHFSILEKMAGIKNQELSEYYHTLAKGNPDHYLVLTSGKGTPSTLPEGSYYINFASLERAVKNLSKIELVQHLNALREHHK